MSHIVDREREIAALRGLLGPGLQSLALVYGRRRVGKTYLLTHLWGPETTFYFTASATTPEVNRRALIAEAALWSGETLRPEDHPTWRTVFRTLLELRPERDIVVVLDEVQYLAGDERGLLELSSELNAVWEGGVKRRGGLLLVLSGSAVRTLAALRDGGSPLYGRLDGAWQLHPFDYFDAGRMVGRYAPVERIQTYAAFGGIPKYLAALDDTRPLADNIVELLLEPSGAVRLQLETILAQEEGLRDLTKYQGILRSVGIKRRELGEMAASLGQKLDTPFRRMVAQLVELGFLESEKSFDEARNRGFRYRISDPALRMFYGLVVPNESAIASAGARTVWRERLSRQVFPTYVGQHVFEDVVRQAYLRHAEARGLPPVDEWGRWVGKDRDGRDVEMDLVVRMLDGRTMTGSAKLRQRPASAAVLVQHLADLRRLADAGRAWAKEALDPASPLLFASGAGFKDSFRRTAEDLGHPLIVWSAEDLF